MSDIAIKVQGLSKQYRIGKREGYKTIRESIVGAITGPFSRLLGKKKQLTTDSFWALKDVGFNVNQGDVVGIIGRNGAGKSTLLKILSRITEPTEGQIEITGRVGSLLEVGTGFHPELTGRENIYLNGAILGMRHAEISRKFDEIVAFAETEKFLDTPVKYYSSGMYTRLAFAVAAHLEPEVLVVDEVLAVGDAGFQQKCLGKMQDVSRTGRTVLFVSHNMGAIASLCTKAIFLRSGQVAFQGEVAEAIRYYNETIGGTAGEVDLREWRHRTTKVTHTRVTKLVTRGLDGQVRSTFTCTEPLTIEIEVQFDGPLTNVDVALAFMAGDGTRLFTSHMSDKGAVHDCASGKTVFKLKLEPNLLRVGPYYGAIAVFRGFGNFLDVVESVPLFDISANPEVGTWQDDGRWGHMHLGLDWSATNNGANAV